MSAPAAYIIGSPLAASVVDRIGRKSTLLLVAVPQVMCWILIAKANSVAMLCLAKGLGGIGGSVTYVCLPMYAGEVCEPKVRGRVTASNTLLVIVGAILINLYGSFCNIETTAYISLSVPLLFVVTFMWMPESPYYYLMKGKIEKARISLKRLRRMDDVEEELKGLTAHIQRQCSEPGTIVDVFMISSNRKACIVLCLIRLFQQFSGISAFAYYNQYLFQQSGSDYSPITCALVFFSVYLLMALVGSLTIDKFGRRSLLLTSLIGTTFALLSEGVYFYLKDLNYDVSSFSWFPLVAMIVFIASYSPGLGICPSLMSGEMLSAPVKAKTLGILNINFAISTALSLKVFQSLNSLFGMHVPFLVFGFSSLAAIFFCYYLVPETKRKTLEEIQMSFKGKKTDKGIYECVKV